ncbi:hypothetical protein DSAG12_01683 [Promethearchaeum syntrophicum]|uniref:Uncharacterized protein n=1 Tax=Promethearchaeum syntrophicum TaxID=2594042 RepID=A0A5B9DB61_9ARCH|nr:hypothetical protein [Candidatus Prometheoarchaeum syntrophicum]QEE15856.1 hypothetical protein DSAG12_01683 [Candidatus Prometheoarchaeum syntrophicum]
MGNKGQVVLSIGISLIIMTAISYFMVPYLVPKPADSEEIPSGLILQSTTLENSTYIEKSDSDLNETIIPSMETIITTNGNSSLEVTFSASMFLYIHPDLMHGNAFSFNITLEIEGVVNQTIVIFHQRGIDNSSFIFAEFYPYSVYLEAKTSTLEAGSYSINVWWNSNGNANGLNKLTNGYFLASNPYFLNVKEISA